MLRILRGPDHKRNTATLLQMLTERTAAQVEGQILLVPEQYSFDSERMLCRLGGDTVCRYAEVLSFTRLCDRVECACGGAANRWLDRSGRLLAAAQAVDQVLSRIKLYASVCKKPEFLEMFLLAADEFGNYGVTPETLRSAAARMEGQLAVKLEELSILLESYYAVNAQARDPVLRLRNLADQLERGEYADGREIWINGFTDFTSLELEIVRSLLRAAQSVTIALPYEPLSGGGNAFPSAVETAAALRKFCAAENIPVETVTLGFDESVPPDLLAVQRALAQPAAKTREDASENVLCVQAGSRDEMCRVAVRRILTLLRGGARCRDIAVACQNEQTLPVLESALRRAELPYFLSGRDGVADHSAARAVLAALRSVTFGMERDDVIDYLKSGVTSLSEDACDRLENYAILWNIHGSRWEQPFTMNPRELTELWRDGDKELLAQLNAWRAAAIGPLASFGASLRGAQTVGAMARAVAAFLDDSGFYDRMQEYADVFYADGEFLLAQQYAQICEILQNALGQMDLILRDCVREPEEFFRLFETMLRGCTVGAVPAAADQIAVGTAASVRGRAVPHLLILDADDGHFPAAVAGSGVFTEEERRKLLAAELSLAPDRADAMERELGGLYQTLRAATRSLALLCADGTPSYLMQRVGAARRTNGAQIPLSAAEAASALLQCERETDDDPAISACMPEIGSRSAYDFGALSPDSVRRLYGEEFRLSASQVDAYADCRFSYFMKYGLHAKKREEIRFTAAEFGTFVHKVLEDTARAVMERGDFRTVPQAEILRIAAESADRYAATHLAAMMEKDERFAETFLRNRAEALAVVRDMAEELSVSDFDPAAFELHFDDGAEMPAIRAQGERGTCMVRGFVDRVDLYRDGGTLYARVVDYKTGVKDFDYADLQVGKGMQMLLYLFALERGGAAVFGDQPAPAGVLYVPARQEFVSLDMHPTPEDAAKKQAEKHKRKGLVRNSDTLLHAMEHYGDGARYLPVSKKGGDVASGEELAMLERHVFGMLREIADGIASGAVMPNPIERGEHGACRYCDYRDACQKDYAPHTPRPLKDVGNRPFFKWLSEKEGEHEQ